MSNIETLDLATISIDQEISKNLRGSLAKLDPEDTSSELVVCDFLIGKKPLRIKVKGTLTSRGISIKKSEWGTRHSLGVDVSDRAMENMNGIVDLISGIKEVDETWDIKNIFFKSKWYPQMKIDTDNKNKYRCNTVPKMFPSKPNDDLCKGTNVEIDTEVGAWFSVSNENKKCGVYFSFIKVTFDMLEDEELKESPPKRVKKN